MADLNEQLREQLEHYLDGALCLGVSELTNETMTMNFLKGGRCFDLEVRGDQWGISPGVRPSP